VRAYARVCISCSCMCSCVSACVHDSRQIAAISNQGVGRNRKHLSDLSSAFLFDLRSKIAQQFIHVSEVLHDLKCLRIFVLTTDTNPLF